MPYRGRWQYGEEKALAVLCSNASGTPTPPDAAPQVEFYGSAGKVAGLARSLPALDQVAAPGLFQATLFLTSALPLGLVTVTYRWTVGAFSGLATDTFEIIAGGDSKGHVIALSWLEAPQANYLVQQLTSGAIRARRNPRL